MKELRVSKELHDSMVKLAFSEENHIFDSLPFKRTSALCYKRKGTDENLVVIGELKPVHGRYGQPGVPGVFLYYIPSQENPFPMVAKCNSLKRIDVEVLLTVETKQL